MKTVIFLGKRHAPGSPRREYPGAELWGTTHSQESYERAYGRIDDWTSWWDLHPVERTPFYDGIKARRPKTYAWYQTLPAHDRPLWMLEVDPTIPASVRFPRERVQAAFPIEDEVGQVPVGGMFTCQVDWMMAYAILEGYEHIILHGHGVSQDPAHMAAHRGILYWVAVARTLGIRVTVLAPSWYRAPIKAYAVEAGGWLPATVKARR